MFSFENLFQCLLCCPLGIMVVVFIGHLVILTQFFNHPLCILIINQKKIMRDSTNNYRNLVSILLKQINKVRSQPKSLIPVLQQRMKKYDEEGKYYPVKGFNFSVKTRQGVQGVQNLIKFLQKQTECIQLKWSFDLHRAADRRCQYLGLGEQNRHNKYVTMEIGELVSQFTDWRGHLIELTFYGFIEPKQFICQLLLDDGHQKKQNREQFFNRMSTLVGIGINTHPKYLLVVVLIFAMHVAKKERPISSESTSTEELQFCGADCAIY